MELLLHWIYRGIKLTDIDERRYAETVNCGQPERFGEHKYTCDLPATHAHKKLGYYLCADHSMIALLGLSDGLIRLPIMPEGLKLTAKQFS